MSPSEPGGNRSAATRVTQTSRRPGGGATSHGADVHSAGELLALAVSYRHSTARHAGEGPELQPPVTMHRGLDFLAEALMLGIGGAR